jgi:hypothetical protein
MHRVLPDSGAAPASTRVRGCTQPHEQSCGACLEERFFEPLTAAAAPAPDMATAEMIAHSTARPPRKHRCSDMRGAQHAEAARPTPTMVNRRAPDKTHTRQPAPERPAGRARAEWRRIRATPRRADTAPFCPGAPGAHRAAAPRAHPPPWASSPGRCRGAHAVAATRRRA